jgi:hypothetical protein
MAPKAKLTDEQHQWVYDYIVSVKNKSQQNINMKKLILGMFSCRNVNIVRTKKCSGNRTKIYFIRTIGSGKPSLKIPATDVTNCRILQNTTIRAG